MPLCVTPTTTVLTLRRRELAPRLDTAHLPRRFIPLDEIAATLRQPRDPALLLDTIGLLPPQLTAILQLIRRADLPTIVIIDPADRAMLRLMPFCPLVRVLVSNSANLAELGPWIRQLPFEDRRYQVERKPFVIGLPDIDPIAVRSDLTILLHALYGSSSMEVAADRSGQSRVTLQRSLRTLRAVLALPSGLTARYTPAAMADIIYSALHTAE